MIKPLIMAAISREWKVVVGVARPRASVTRLGPKPPSGCGSGTVCCRARSRCAQANGCPGRHLLPHPPLPSPADGARRFRTTHIRLTLIGTDENVHGTLDIPLERLPTDAHEVNQWYMMKVVSGHSRPMLRLMLCVSSRPRVTPGMMQQQHQQANAEKKHTSEPKRQHVQSV